ncbi:hypothetical protein CkaCkLH20_11389 [Colletotrichum karsti]|uniref:Pentatricopeptide repeat-containing protein-mitochondrial domain-containing protein n=1 Tax=Colletotrichum karsti TaxID=1095194 RepID=A0A9P6HW50_9PEZI|nr:uncharacterized protein CkaCkLH20_11389 [Colletotrichum karsti]KAF9871220.1 hypothetical protein CkaCkLH20_11389 [Colletotrichum karsti]
MKALSRIDGSVCGAILSTRPSAARAAVSSRPKLRDDRPTRAPAPQCRRKHTADARAQGPHCPQTASWLLSTFLPAPSKRRRPTYEALRGRQRVQQYSHANGAATAAANGTDTANDKVVLSGKAKRNLLQYIHPHKDVGTVEEHLELLRDPYLNRYAQPEPTRLFVSERKVEDQYPSFQDAVHGSHSLEELVKKLAYAVYIRQRYPWRMSLEALYEVYTTLPEPRMIQMPAVLRHKLLAAFGVPRKRDSRTMLRYFSLIGEVKDCGLALRRSEWNHALSLSSRYVGRTTETETEAALHLWKEMEATGAKGNEVTFNILFDAASKSGNFELAEMIYKEMESRGIFFGRYHHVSLIHFFGLKRDADGVRAAYKEMVQDGQLVDTAVLNCVISSFLRCGEELAAVRVYRYMKTNVAKGGEDLPERNYNHKKLATTVLEMLTRVAKKYPELRPKYQELATIKPDLRTYRTLLEYFCVKTGNFERVVQYLDEMRHFQVPIHGSVFLMLFKGFSSHGGEFRSDWSPARLQKVYGALIESLDTGPRRRPSNDVSDDLYLDTWLVIWALRAFRKCTTPNNVLSVYDQLKERWDIGEERAEFMNAYVNNLLAGRDSTVFPGFHAKPKAGKRRPL